MRIRSECIVNRRLFFVVLVTLLLGTLFSTMSAFGEDDGECIEGDCYNGEGTLIFSNGDKYVGMFKDGNQHGHGTYTWPYESKYAGEYVGEWKGDSMHGHGTYTWASGSKYVGEWLDGRMHGQGTYTWIDGRKYVGEWKNGKHHGQGTATGPDGFKIVGKWQDGKAAEIETSTWPGGSLFPSSDDLKKLSPKESWLTTEEELEVLEEMLEYYNFGAFAREATGSTGRSESQLMNLGRLESLYILLDYMRKPEAELVDYCAGRMLDLNFATQIVETLKEIPTLSRETTELQKAGDEYRKVTDTAETVRYHRAFDGEKRKELLRKLDVPGRLRTLKRIMINMLDEIGYLNPDPDVNPEWAQVYEFLQEDLASMVQSASIRRKEDSELLTSMRDVLANSVVEDMSVSTPVRESYEELKRLRTEREDALVDLVSAGLIPGLPVEFLENNMFLNAYMDSIIAYDKEEIRLFNMLKEVEKDSELLDTSACLFIIKKTLHQRVDLLKGDRRLFAATQLLGIAEMCVSGDNYARSANSINQAILYASMALRLDPANESASQIIERCSERLRELDPHKLTAEEFIRQGFNYAVSGDYDSALRILTKGSLVYPNNNNLLEWHVVVSYVTDGLDSAVSIWRQKHPERGPDGWRGGAIRPNVAYLAYKGLYDFAERAESEKMLYASFKHYSLAYRAAAGLKDYDYTWMKEEQQLLRDKIFTIYKQLPLRPEPSDQAKYYAEEAQQYIEQGMWQLAEGRFRQALEKAPWWPEGYYNLALVTGAIYWPSPLAVQEMELYLDLAPNGTYVRNAKNKLKAWNGAIRKAVNRGAQVSEGLPFLITPDAEGW